MWESSKGSTTGPDGINAELMWETEWGRSCSSGPAARVHYCSGNMSGYPPGKTAEIATTEPADFSVTEPEGDHTTFEAAFRNVRLAEDGWASQTRFSEARSPPTTSGAEWPSKTEDRSPPKWDLLVIQSALVDMKLKLRTNSLKLIEILRAQRLSSNALMGAQRTFVPSPSACPCLADQMMSGGNHAFFRPQDLQDCLIYLLQLERSSSMSDSTLGMESLSLDSSSHTMPKALCLPSTTNYIPAQRVLLAMKSLFGLHEPSGTSPSRPETSGFRSWAEVQEKFHALKQQTNPLLERQNELFGSEMKAAEVEEASENISRTTHALDCFVRKGNSFLERIKSDLRFGSVPPAVPTPPSNSSPDLATTSSGRLFSRHAERHYPERQW